MVSRKVMALMAAALMAAVVVGCGGGSKGDAPAGGGTALKGDVAKGQVAFESTCISCHGGDAKGMPGSGKNLVKRSEWMKKQDDAALLAFLKTGRTAGDKENTTKVDMPPKGGNPALTDEDLTNIVAYVRSLQAAAGEK